MLFDFLPNRISEKYYFSRKLNQAEVEKHPSFFIISSGRSGSTLLRRVLMEHYDIHIPPESYDVIPQVFLTFLKNKNKRWDVLIKSSLSILQASGINEFWKLNLTDVKNDLENLQPDKRNPYELINYIYLKHAKLVENESSMIGDKTPFLGLRMDFLKMYYPNSKIIHLVRDPRDVMLSRKESFGQNYEESIRRWIITVKGVHKYSTGSKLFEIRYEDLLQNGLSEVEKISQFLGVERRNSCKDEVCMGDDDLPHHSNVKNTIMSNRAYRWKKTSIENLPILNSDLLQRYLKFYNYN